MLVYSKHIRSSNLLIILIIAVLSIPISAAVRSHNKLRVHVARPLAHNSKNKKDKDKSKKIAHKAKKVHPKKVVAHAALPKKKTRDIAMARDVKEQKRKALARRQVEVARKIAQERKRQDEVVKHAPKFHPVEEKKVAKNTSSHYTNKSAPPDSFGNGLIKRVPVNEPKSSGLSFDNKPLYKEGDENFHESSNIDLEQKLDRNVARENSSDFVETVHVKAPGESKASENWIDKEDGYNSEGADKSKEDDAKFNDEDEDFSDGD